MPDSPGGSTGGGRDVLFEETLALTDQAGASSLVTLTRVLALVMIVSTLGSTVLVAVIAAATFVFTLGGIDVALAFAEAIWSERPLPVVGFVLVAAVAVGVGSLVIVGFLLQTRRAFDEQVQVRVTGAGVTVRRTGGRYWRSSGVEIPFDAITSVERLDPDESSTRIELGDWRAKKFIGGRSQNWIRIERDAGPAVYVGSDRPIELAETIARRAPGVESAEPF